MTTTFQPMSAYVAGFSGSVAGLKVCLVTNELAELHQNGGIGTANSGLLQELAKHDVQMHILYTAGLHQSPTERVEELSTLSKLGATIVFLQDLVPAEWLQTPRKIAFATFQFLQKQDADIILFNDYLGNGFYACQAKRLGLAFRGVPLITTIHGPTRWACNADERPLATYEQEEICLLEAKAIEYSDAVIGVSEHILRWCSDQNVRLPFLTFTHKNIMPRFLHRRSGGRLAPHELKEVVFFGRQDVRKGFRIFIDAVKRLAPDHPHIKITLLGKFSRIGGEHSGALALDELRSVSNLLDFRHDFDRERALNYLQRPGVLAVIASLDENSPCTVFECVQAGIPFISCGVGGIPELIDPADHASVLVAPTGKALAQRIATVIEQGLATPALGFDSALVAEQQLTFLAKIKSVVREADQRLAEACATQRPLVSICITHFNRSKMLDHLLAQIEKQTYDAIEVIVVDDGSTNPDDVKYFEALQQHRFTLKTLRIENSYLGAARNAAVRLAEGEFVKFQDDDNLPMPEEIETFVRAALWAKADVLTCMAYFFRQDSDLKLSKSYLDVEYLPLGASLPLSVFRNEYGDANALVRRSTFNTLGGFTELRGIGAEDYEFFGRAEVAGYRVNVVPMPLFYYRVNADSMLQTTSIYANVKRARRSFGSRSAAWVDQIIDMTQNVQLIRELNDLAWYRSGSRRFGEYHQQLLQGDPNSSACLKLFIDLASRYERLEDLLHLVLRANPIGDALRWLEDSADRFAEIARKKREFLTGRPRLIQLSHMASVELIEPAVDLPSFDLTLINSLGVMVHPLSNRETKVIVSGVLPQGAQRIAVKFHHAGLEGSPVCVAFEVVRFHKAIAKTEWQGLDPGDTSEVTIDLDGGLTGACDLILKSTTSGSQHYAWVYAMTVICEGETLVN